MNRRVLLSHAEPVALTQEDKDVVIRHAGPHRTVVFNFERNKRNKLVCVGASVPSSLRFTESAAKR